MTYTDFYFYPKLFALLFVVGLLQCLFHKKQNVANIISKAILLAFSFYTLFYYNWQYALCLFGVIGVTYIGAIVIDRKLGCHRKHLTTLFVSILVITLGVFKYLNFFAGTFCKAVHLSWTDINIILPIGISFYIFSAISYLLDVSWGTMKAETNVLDVALFLAFFPKIVCGPIVKGYEFIPQLKEYRRIQWENVCDGMQIYVFGLFKKMVLADHIAVFVNDVYSKPVAYDNATIWLAVFSYFLQLYFDFSGYSDMAIGLGEMFGFHFLENFNYPYISKSITEFWRRWHISLSSWFKDYVYIPLGGNRKGYKRQLLNLFVVWLLCGLWHGASWNFVLWGAFYGIVLWIEKTFLSKILAKIPKVFAHLYTMIIVMLAWVLFSHTDISQAIHSISMLFGNCPAFYNAVTFYYIRNNAFLFMICFIACTPVAKTKWNVFKKLHWLYPVVLMILMILSTAFIINGTYNPFLYFRF